MNVNVQPSPSNTRLADLLNRLQLPEEVKYAFVSKTESTTIGDTTLKLLENYTHRFERSETMNRDRLQPLLEQFASNFNLYIDTLPLGDQTKVITRLQTGFGLDTERARDGAGGQSLSGEEGLRSFLNAYLYIPLNDLLRETHLTSGGVRLYWRVVGGGKSAGRPDLELVYNNGGSRPDVVIAITELKTTITMPASTVSAIDSVLQRTAILVHNDGDVSREDVPQEDLPSNMTKIVRQVCSESFPLTLS